MPFQPVSPARFALKECIWGNMLKRLGACCHPLPRLWLLQRSFKIYIDELLPKLQAAGMLETVAAHRQAFAVAPEQVRRLVVESKAQSLLFLGIRKLGNHGPKHVFVDIACPIVILNFLPVIDTCLSERLHLAKTQTPIAHMAAQVLTPEG